MPNPGLGGDIPAADNEILSLYFSGGLSETGALILDDYAVSLEGWHALLELLAGLHFHSLSEFKKLRSADLLRIEITAERRGSWETVLVFTFLAAAGGIIGNRVDAGLVWSFRKLVSWYREAISEFVRKKAQTTDITEIAVALRAVASEKGILLTDAIDEDMALLFAGSADGVSEDDDQRKLLSVDRSQALAEKLDHLLKQATRPLDRSCDRVSLRSSTGSPLLEIGPADRAVIAAPLTLPPPSREWVRTKIKFERINRKTGRALFYFSDEEGGLGAAHYSRIIDPSYRKPHNPYTQAFNDDQSLEVWIRQTHPETGRLNFQWEIDVRDPDEGTFFRGQPPE